MTPVKTVKPYLATASRVIHAPAEKVYGILADYRDGHPKILPKPHFLPMQVEAGGIGAGTYIRFQMRVFGKLQDYHAAISEPEPGRQINETYLEPKDLLTRFFIQPCSHGEHTAVRITIEGKTRASGVAGCLERVVTGIYLRRVFKKELRLLAVLAESREVNVLER